ncbi:MAG: histidine kinase [Bacteroidota bacterium]
MRNIFSYSLKKFVPLYVAGWLIWALIQSLILHRLNLSWELSVKDSLVTGFLLGMCCYIAITLYQYYQPGRSNRLYRLFFALVISLIFSSASNWSLKFLLGNDPAYLDFLSASMPLRFVIAFLILAFLTILNWLWNSLAEQKESEKRSNEAEQLVKDAELATLRQQLQPHFLFNSLNSISALAGSRPNEARKMIQQLSDFLRGTLKKDEQKTVSMNEELEHLKLYLEIEKVRFGHRLKIDIDSAPESLACNLPPLLLQPIVENAIKFGLYDTIGEITISIETRLENSYLHIEIKNPFDEKTQNTNQGTGFGLNSVQRRLFLLYSRNDLLITEKKENQFITQLKIPQTA